MRPIRELFQLAQDSPLKAAREIRLLEVRLEEQGFDLRESAAAFLTCLDADCEIPLLDNKGSDLYIAWLDLIQAVERTDPDR